MKVLFYYFLSELSDKKKNSVSGILALYISDFSHVSFHMKTGLWNCSAENNNYTSLFIHTEQFKYPVLRL